MKKVNNCVGGGYQKLQFKLLSEAEIKCEVCQSLLKSHHFQAEGLEKTIQSVLAGERERASAANQNEDKEPAQKNTQNGDDAEDNPSNFLAAQAYLKTLEPYMVALEPGTHGKKFPIRCTVCRCKKHPEGKVLELSVMRPNPVKHFTRQHIGKCDKHRRGMKMLEEAASNKVVVPKVDCAALRVEDEDQGGHLWQFRGEFKLWAEYSNFEGCAKHKYFQQDNGGAWFVRAANCAGEVDEHPDRDFQVCKACLDLGKPHGVTWFFMVFPFSPIHLAPFFCCIRLLHSPKSCFHSLSVELAGCHFCRPESWQEFL